MELLELLSCVPLFASLSRDSLIKVSALCEEMTVSAGTYLSRQGDLGATFYLVGQGQAIVQRMDETGYERPIEVIDEQHPYYGATSLFLELPRDATVVARTEMRLWTLHRVPFQDLLHREPAVEQELTIPSSIQACRAAPRLGWQTPGEQVTFHTRKHWIICVKRAFAWTLITAALVALALHLGRQGALPFPTLYLLIPLLAIAGIGLSWIVADWRSDYYVVTNRRVSYREHVAFLYDARQDAPLDQVQHVTVSRDQWGHWLGYGYMIVQTNAGKDTLRFRYVTDPEGVRTAIFDEQSRTRATHYAEQRWRIRDVLAKRVTVEEAAQGSRGTAATASLATDQETHPATVAALPTRRTSQLGDNARSAAEIQRQSPGELVLRQHWFHLLLSICLPLLVFGCLAVLTTALLRSRDLPAALAGPAALTTSLVLTCASLGWLGYRYVAWHSRRYVLSDDRISSLGQSPFRQSITRRKVELEDISEAHYMVPSAVASVLGFGDVIVRTADQRELRLAHVPHPAEVRDEVLRRVHHGRIMRQRSEARHQQELDA